MVNIECPDLFVVSILAPKNQTFKNRTKDIN